MDSSARCSVFDHGVEIQCTYRGRSSQGGAAEARGPWVVERMVTAFGLETLLYSTEEGSLQVESPSQDTVPAMLCKR